MARETSRFQLKKAEALSQSEQRTEGPRQTVEHAEADPGRNRKKLQRQMIGQNAAQQENTAAPIQPERTDVGLVHADNLIMEPARPDALRPGKAVTALRTEDEGLTTSPVSDGSGRHGLQFGTGANLETTSKLRHSSQSPLTERPASAASQGPELHFAQEVKSKPDSEAGGDAANPLASAPAPETEGPEHLNADSPSAPVNTNHQKDAQKKRKTGSRLRFEESGQTATGTAPTGKGRQGLRFEGVDKPALPTKLRHDAAKPVASGPAPSKTVKAKQYAAESRRAVLGAVPALPLKAAAWSAHRELSEYEDDNIGLEGAHKLEEGAESGARLMDRSSRSRKLKPSRQTEKQDHRLNLRQQRTARENPGQGSNPLSRWQQKQAIKRQYAANLRGARVASSAAAAKKATAKAKAAEKNAKKAAKEAARESEAAAAFVWRHKTAFLIVGVAVMVLTFLLNALSSCSIMLEGGASLLGSSTYPGRDEAMLGAEAAYAGMETELQNYLDTYEDTHDYDEYHYELDGIGHDPYVLISLLSALHPGEWTLADVSDVLQVLFDRQYILTETVTTETRRNGDDEPYTYYICTVKLENTDLSRLTATMLNEDGLHLYATYMATRGNRPDLFPTSEYPNASTQQDYLHYDVPPDALEDETFAAMLKEAEKYLGYPYVWGGASPSTSFDCSGFVSWVINHSGWDVGRLTAQGLFNICTPVTAANARPGDLVLFKGTYNTTEVSHVGIYVGNHMMIHCGDPISYADLNNSYWQTHLYCYGRLS